MEAVRGVKEDLGRKKEWNGEMGKGKNIAGIKRNREG